jgi:hypothetical protein
VRLFLLLMLLFAVFLVHAQDDESWTIEERCLPEAITPPENWSYDGTILVQSEQGIHGINQDWETRRILAYSPDNIEDSYLSPDGQTWITFQGSDYCLGSCDINTIVLEAMSVHDLTSLNPSSYQIDWDLFFRDKWKEAIGLRGLPILRWLSPSQFLFVKALQPSGEEIPVRYDLLNHEVQVYETPIFYEDWHNISPDGTLVIDRVDNLDFTYQYFLSNPQDLSPIVEIPADFSPFGYYTLDVWSPDSQYFLASKNEDDNIGNLGERSIWLMDRNGEALYSIVDSLTLSQFLYLNIQWSPDGHYLLILGDRNQISWLIDLENRHSYNLCQEDLFRAAWSPNSQQIAFQTFNWENESYSPLTIFEPASWQVYEITDNPDASPIGWQATGE